MRAVRGVDRGDARGVGRGDRDRARALRGVHPGRVPRRHRRPALQAVRGHGDGRGGDLGLHRAHAHAGAVRAPAQARAPRVEALPRRSTAASRWLTRVFLRGVGPGAAPPRASPRASSSSCSLVAGLLFWRVPVELRAAPRTRATSIGSIILPDGATLERTRKTGELNSGSCSPSNAAVEHAFVGAGLRPHRRRQQDQRRHARSSRSRTGTSASSTAPQIARDLHEGRRRFATAWRSSFNPPAIRGLGTAGGFEFYVAVARRRRPEAPGPGDAATSPTALAQGSAAHRHQLVLPPDGAAAPRRGGPREGDLARRAGADVFDALQSTMGALYVNDFNKFGRTYRVQVQAEAPFRAQPDRSGSVYVRSTTTRRDDPAEGADPHHERRRRRAARPLQRLPRRQGAGRAASRACPRARRSQAVEHVAAQTLPEGYTLAWTGQAFQEKRTGKRLGHRLRPRASCMVFLILAALYERWRLPVGRGARGAVRGAGRARRSWRCAAWRTTSTSRSAWWC